MSTKIFGAFLLLVVVQSARSAVLPFTPKIDLKMLNVAYYDPKTGLKLKGEIESTAKGPLGQITFRGLECECKKLVCSCCTGLDVPMLKIDQHSCVSLAYVPKDFAIKTALSLNNKELMSQELLGKNPPPVCVSPPNLPFVSFCLRLFDIYTSGKNLHACLDVETRIINAPVLVLHFNCMQMGADGLSWGHPDSSTVSILHTQTQSSTTEEYDDVDFEPEKGSSTASSHNAQSTTASSHNAQSTTASSHSAGSTTASSHNAESTTASSHNAGSTTASSHNAESTTASSHNAGSTTASSHNAESTTASSHNAGSTTASSHSAESTTANSNSAESTTANSNSAESTTANSNSAESTTANSNSAESTTANSNSAESTTANSNSSESNSSDSNSSNSNSSDSNSSNSNSNSQEDDDHIGQLKL